MYFEAQMEMKTSFQYLPKIFQKLGGNWCLLIFSS